MGLGVSAWNLEPNRVWFVRLEDSGSGISVELYLSEMDAAEKVNRQAYGSTTGYGSDLELSLTSDPDAPVQISKHQSTLPWHMKVTGSPGDSTQIFKINEFVDLDSINHPIFRNAGLAQVRAKAEIDAHTHAMFTRAVQMGTHLPELKVGDVCSVSSVIRNISELGQVMRHLISGTPSSLVDTLDLASFKPLKR